MIFIKQAALHAALALCVVAPSSMAEAKTTYRHRRRRLKAGKASKNSKKATPSPTIAPTIAPTSTSPSGTPTTSAQPSESPSGSELYLVLFEDATCTTEKDRSRVETPSDPIDMGALDYINYVAVEIEGFQCTFRSVLADRVMGFPNQLETNSCFSMRTVNQGIESEDVAYIGLTGAPDQVLMQWTALLLHPCLEEAVWNEQIELGFEFEPNHCLEPGGRRLEGC